MRAVPMLILAAAGGYAAAAIVAEPGGVFTADIEMSVPSLFGGEPFPAVINPDADHPDKIGPTNDSGALTGPIDLPTTFAYTGLPVYAIVDPSGMPWDSTTPLFADDGMGGEDRSQPLFNLQHIGDLTLSLERVPLRNGTVYYPFDSFFDVFTELSVYPVGGQVMMDTPPFGAPNFLWYGLGEVSLNAGPIAAASNDAQWTSGWPGTTLDKNFFPFIPAPGSALLIVLGGVALAGFRGR